jgi:triosephosphate isomerase
VDDVAEHLVTVLCRTRSLERREEGTDLDVILEQLVDEVCGLTLSHS